MSLTFRFLQFKALLNYPKTYILIFFDDFPTHFEPLYHFLDYSRTCLLIFLFVNICAYSPMILSSISRIKNCILTFPIVFSVVRIRRLLVSVVLRLRDLNILRPISVVLCLLWFGFWFDVSGFVSIVRFWSFVCSFVLVWVGVLIFWRFLVAFWIDLIAFLDWFDNFKEGYCILCVFFWDQGIF